MTDWDDMVGWMRDDQPRAITPEDAQKARRAQIPVHCAACGGEFPGTTELHNGICDECQKLTHGPNYRLIAELNRKAEEVERLGAQMDGLKDELSGQFDEVTRLEEDLGEAENHRHVLKVALEHYAFDVFPGDDRGKVARGALFAITDLSGTVDEPYVDRARTARAPMPTPGGRPVRRAESDTLEARLSEGDDG